MANRKRVKQLRDRDNPRGLTDDEVALSRQKHGSNVIDSNRSTFSELGRKIVRDPMLLLLVAAGTVYFIIGNAGDGWFMFAAIIAIVSISLYQDRRSQKALDALRALTQPNCRVIRNGSIVSVQVSSVVVGDYLLAEEGATIAADGIIQRSNDFAVNESILTGESLALEKTTEAGNNEVYQGTVVTRGLAVCVVTAVGRKTKLGQIGQSLETIESTETPLQKQIAWFVKRMTIVGVMFFIAVWAINLHHTHSMLDSLLKALSLAMSILPEEIPVAFVTFMAIGAWRLSKLGIVVKHISTIETLGSATVICADKTGTITQNRMELSNLYVFATDSIEKIDSGDPNIKTLVAYAMWASEPIPFDPMETALHEAYARLVNKDERKNYRIVHEYPLAGHPPYMTHIFQNGDGARIVAAKGAPEGILSVCGLTKDEIERVTAVVTKLSAAGGRVLGVAKGSWDGSDFPVTQNEIQFTFLGLVSFYDPPKENMRRTLSGFYNAGINVKMITGDYAATAISIANQIGLKGKRVLTGDEVLQMNEADLQKAVEHVNIFARTYPEAKLKILNALKSNGHVVAMTGDGVNDGPALKAAHIGVAMGKRGTEVAKQVSAMVLSDDDLGRMIDAIAAGRKIYANLKKAIQYIISIHIPIILAVFIPLLMNWPYSVFTPVHVIFLELIMGPTCSIIYENEPLEKELMHQGPRPTSHRFFNWRELLVSVVQGLIIAAGAMSIYQYSILNEFTEQLTRTMVFSTLLSANISLTLVNRSFAKPSWVSIRYRNHLMPLIILITIALSGIIFFVRPVSDFFKVTPPSLTQLIIASATGVVSVIWIDLFKVMKRRTPLITIILLLIAGFNAQSQNTELRTMVERNESAELRKLYRSNNYSLAWKNATDKEELIDFIGSSYIDGLNPSDYNLWLLISDADSVASDLLLTRAFLDLAHDLYQGRIDPNELFPDDWDACTTPADYSGLLLAALHGEGVCETLELLKPMDDGYEGLKYMLSNFQSIQRSGTLPSIPFGDPIEFGDVDERVADIRTRLSALGLLMPQFNNGDIRYDSILLMAVKRFQTLHGLTADGSIGRKTQQSMQITADDYISAITANLEKYRWQQSRLLDRSIKINIPSFELKFTENGRTDLHMKVIIGRSERPTPIINSSITAIIINPTWTVPPTIFREDLLPAVKADRTYLDRHNMKVFNAGGKEINADSIDWSLVTERNFRYHIQQDAGPTNPLGRIKFFIPNHHTIYLHDTNMPSLFASRDRAVSSGCVRVESPMALVRLLEPITGWTEQMVRDQIDCGETRLILIKDPMPVHTTYFTAYVENNQLYFVKDLYGYDKVILNALQKVKQPLLR